MKYLYKSSQIRESINQLFSLPNEKWAIVGFIGYGALDQLPKGVTGLNVVCWPRAGATDPGGVRRLLDAGISVFFCENLHHKVYWAKDVGLIIGSANLSTRALGGSVQHEFCVYCDDPAFDIQSILSGLHYSAADQEKLDALDIAHVAAGIKDPDLDKNTSNPLSFLEASREKMPKKWKIVTWVEKLEDSSHIREAVKKELGQTRFVNSNEVDDGVFEKGDFVLQVRVDQEDKIQRVNCKWLRVEFVMKYKRQSTIVQAKPMANGVSPPFLIGGDFPKKFKEAFNASTWEQICDDKAVVRQKFINKLRSLMTKDV